MGVVHDIPDFSFYYFNGFVKVNFVYPFIWCNESYFKLKENSHVLEWKGAAKEF